MLFYSSPNYWPNETWLAPRAHLSQAGGTLPRASRPSWGTEPGTDSAPCCSLLGRPRCGPCYLPDRAIVAPGEKGFVGKQRGARSSMGPFMPAPPGRTGRPPGQAPPPPRTSRTLGPEEGGRGARQWIPAPSSSAATGNSPNSESPVSEHRRDSGRPSARGQGAQTCTLKCSGSTRHRHRQT